MRAAAPLLIIASLGGCNEIYGLAPTEGPGLDAAPTDCPADGRAPQFSRAIQQAVPQDCRFYQFNADATLATAQCGAPNYDVMVGRRDELLGKVTGLPDGFAYRDVRPSSTARRIYVLDRTAPATPVIMSYEETTPGTWSRAADASFTFTGAHILSSMFRGATGDRVIVADINEMYEMTEWEREGDAWVQRGEPRAAPADYRGGRFVLTTDGRRAVYVSGSGDGLVHAYRPDLASWFGAPEPLVGAPTVDGAQLTDDCTRLYYTVLDSVFYSRQQ